MRYQRKKNTQRKHHHQNEPRTMFSKFFLEQVLKNFPKYEFHQDLDQFENGIDIYLSFRKGMLRDFNIQLYDTYSAEIDNYQGKINRVDLLLPHDRRSIWNQEQSLHDHMDTDNWKERVQTLVYSHKTALHKFLLPQHNVPTHINIIRKIQQKGAPFCSVSRKENRKITTHSTKSSQPVMTEELFYNFVVFYFIKFNVLKLHFHRSFCF